MTKIKLDKNKMYKITFVHYLDKEDKIYNEVQGKYFYRMRNFFLDLGYEVDYSKLEMLTN